VAFSRFVSYFIVVLSSLRRGNRFAFQVCVPFSSAVEDLDCFPAFRTTLICGCRGLRVGLFMASFKMLFFTVCSWSGRFASLAGTCSGRSFVGHHHMAFCSICQSHVLRARLHWSSSSLHSFLSSCSQFTLICPFSWLLIFLSLVALLLWALCRCAFLVSAVDFLSIGIDPPHFGRRVLFVSTQISSLTVQGRISRIAFRKNIAQLGSTGLARAVRLSSWSVVRLGVLGALSVQLLSGSGGPCHEKRFC